MNISKKFVKSQTERPKVIAENTQKRTERYHKDRNQKAVKMPNRKANANTGKKAARNLDRQTKSDIRESNKIIA